MIFTNEQSNIIYSELYDWITIYTPGERCYKSRLKKYQKNVWEPVTKVINMLSNKSILNKEEKEFLNLVVYNGPIYRIHNYNPRKKGYVCENDFCQSWSRDIEGVANVPNINGCILLIVGNTVNGINVFELLAFLFKYKYITQVNERKKPKQLCRYEEEQEIVYPIKLEHINEIAYLDKRDLHDWEICKTSIPKEKWERNDIN